MAGILDTIREARSAMGGDVGSFSPSDAGQLGTLAAVAAQGEAGRQGPARQAEAARQAEDEAFRAASLGAAAGQGFPVPDFFAPERGPVDVRPPLAPPRAGDRPLTMEEYLVQATMGFDPLGGALPTDLDRDELDLRREILTTLLDFRTRQDEQRYAAEILPYQRAAELQSYGVPDADIQRLTGISLAGSTPAADSLEGRMIALEEALATREVASGERELERLLAGDAVQDIDTLSIDDALANLGFGAETTTTGRRFEMLGNRINLGPLGELGLPRFGGERTVGRDELVPEFMSNETFMLAAEEAEAMARDGAGAVEIFQELRELATIADAQNQPLPDDAVSVIMEMLSPLINARGGTRFGGTIGG